MSVRIGAVSYLNTKPLIYGLRQLLPNCDLRLELPSRLADQLIAGQLDVALIPSAEFLRGNQFTIVSDACIACRGPVRSVRLLFRKPPSEIQSLALDVGSRTSAVLAQLLLARRLQLRPMLKPLHIDSPLDAVDADALLVIGDRAMKIDQSRYAANWDLGEEWLRDTGLPFVFALWVAAGSNIAPELVAALQTARDTGIEHAQDIADAEAIRYGLTPQDCLIYFLKQLHFTLGPRELQGLDLFRKWAIEHDLLPKSCQQLSLEPT